jgi:outer membrane protein assembly factor BamE (lipoprotein component of BamABCDE complex)
MVTLFQWASLDGWQGVVLPLLSKSAETVYASGYSYFAFRRLRTGMTETQVERLIGKPLKIVATATGDVVWVYSDSPVSRSYRMREVFFDSSKRVVEIVAEFEFD